MVKIKAFIRLTKTSNWPPYLQFEIISLVINFVSQFHFHQKLKALAIKTSCSTAGIEHFILQWLVVTAIHNSINSTADCSSLDIAIILLSVLVQLLLLSSLLLDQATLDPKDINRTGCNTTDSHIVGTSHINCNTLGFGPLAIALIELVTNNRTTLCNILII